MRSLVLLLWLLATSAMAASEITVAPNTLMRLSVASGSVQLDRLEVAERATLLVPAAVTVLQIGELRMGREARIGITPAEQSLRLEIGRAEVAEDAWISARGADGSYTRPASRGRDLQFRLQSLTFASLTLDVRGGRGVPGYAGLDGASGQPGGCTWGRAEAGHDGQDGSNGQPGADGGRVVLELAEGIEVERLQVLLDGGAGGIAGTGGKGGRGGATRGCLLYDVDGAADGQPGRSGQQGPAGQPGELQVIRF